MSMLVDIFTFVSGDFASSTLGNIAILELANVYSMAMMMIMLGVGEWYSSARLRWRGEYGFIDGDGDGDSDDDGDGDGDIDSCEPGKWLWTPEVSVDAALFFNWGFGFVS